MKSKRTRRPAAALAVLGLALAACGGDANGSDATDPAALLPVEVTTVSVESGYAVEDSHAGRVVAARASDLGFDRPGRLAQVLADAGDRVEAGALLARLDTQQLDAQRVQALAQVRQLDAQLAMARLTRKRRERLRASDHVSREAFDQAVHEEQALVAARAAAQAMVGELDAQRALSEIHAPYAGTVVARNADEGAVVAAGQPLLHLIEDSALEVEIGLPPEVGADLESGSTHTVEIEGRSYPARLRAVVPSVARDTRTVTALLQLDPAAAGPRDGDLARVRFARHIEADGFWLPVGALAESHRGLWSTLALVPDEGAGPETWRVDRRQVEVLYSEGERVFARGTLRDGERVVASGVHRVVPGQHVRVAE